MAEEEYSSAGCDITWRAVYISYGILSASVMPIAIWCSYKHIKSYYSDKSNHNKLLYRMSLAVYLITIIASIINTVSQFGSCNIAANIYYQLWYFQWICFILQWFFFIFLLFTRYIFFYHYGVAITYVQHNMYTQSENSISRVDICNV